MEDADGDIELVSCPESLLHKSSSLVSPCPLMKFVIIADGMVVESEFVPNLRCISRALLFDGGNTVLIIDANWSFEKFIFRAFGKPT